jgi:predicted metal-dependent enzyme (double-stranded beta helix superfamily)
MKKELQTEAENDASCPAVLQGDEVFMGFCDRCDEMARAPMDSPEFIANVARHMGELIKEWRMPDLRYLECQSNAMYGSYLLYLNTPATFNVVLDVFMPGQAAIIHNHQCWCAFACMFGVERERLYSVDLDLAGAPTQTVDRICTVGEVRSLGDARNLFHQVECASDAPAVSLHVYGADIGRLERDMWDEKARKFVSFRSNYSNETAGLPVYYDVRR